MYRSNILANIIIVIYQLSLTSQLQLITLQHYKKLYTYNITTLIIKYIEGRTNVRLAHIEGTVKGTIEDASFTGDGKDDIQVDEVQQLSRLQHL